MFRFCFIMPKLTRHLLCWIEWFSFLIEYTFFAGGFIYCNTFCKNANQLEWSCQKSVREKFVPEQTCWHINIEKNRRIKALRSLNFCTVSTYVQWVIFHICNSALPRLSYAQQPIVCVFRSTKSQFISYSRLYSDEMLV